MNNSDLARLGPIFILLVLLGLMSGIIFRAAISYQNFQKVQQQSDQIVYRVETKEIRTPLVFNSFLDSYQSGLEDESIFLSLKNRLLHDKEKFIEVDLKKMKLRLFNEGMVIKEIEVLSKGKEGSWWETPTGRYSVLIKSANLFSSIGEVWMPWSVQFYGNFFIHGWPYYPDGTPVPRGYSGGCIRLSTEDAKVVFDFAERNIPILVLEESDILKEPRSDFVFKVSSNLPPPNVLAKAVLVADLDSGLIILDKNASEPLPIASLVKLMTGVVASEVIYLEKAIVISPLLFSGKFWNNAFSFDSFSPLVGGISLLAGEKYKAFELLYPLLMQSSNQAAKAISSFTGEKIFIEQMNKKAETLGMNETIFADTSGKSPENISTAKDLAKLTKYILEKRKFLFDISKGKNYNTFGSNRFIGLSNYNEFYNYENLIGVKNGETAVAKQTLLTVWDLSTDDGDRRKIVIVVLGSEDRKKDTEIILNWLQDYFGLN